MEATTTGARHDEQLIDVLALRLRVSSTKPSSESGHLGAGGVIRGAPGFEMLQTSIKLSALDSCRLKYDDHDAPDVGQLS